MCLGLCPAEIRGPERFPRLFLNVQSPPLSSGQRYGDCGSWCCCPVRFDEIFGPARAKDILGQSPLPKARICNAHRTVAASERRHRRPALFQSPLLNGLSFSASFGRGEEGADETAAGGGEISGFAIGPMPGIEAYPSNRGTRSGSLLFGVPFGNLKSNTLTPNRFSPL